MNTNDRYETPHVVYQRPTRFQPGGDLINEHKRPPTVTQGGTRHPTLLTTPYQRCELVEI